MNILYIDHYAGSESMGMEFRPYYVAKELIKLGHRVLIVAADFSHLRNWNPQIKEDFELQTIDDIDFLFLHTSRYQGNGFQRFKTMLQFVSKLYLHPKKVLEIMKPDAIICSSTYPLDTYAGQKLAKLSGARLYHEIHDLWPLTPKVLGHMSDHHPFIMLMQRAEISAYKNSRRIISILPNTEVYVRRLGIKTDLTVIPNGLPTSYFEETYAPNESIKSLVDELHEKGHYVVGYAGGLSISNALMDLIDAMKILKKRPIHAIIIGDGIEKDALKRAAVDNNLNVTFHRPIEKNTVIPSLALMDALYIGGTSNEIYQYGISMNKIYDYMMSGVVVVNALGIDHCCLTYAKTSINVNQGDPRSIAKGILTSMELTPEERDEIRRKARAFVKEKHNYESIGKDFEEAISN
ncbi:glycosyltransferase family 4 protein [Guggenheimella bovis]